MSEQELKRLFGYAEVAVKHLQQNSVPPEPSYYELLYTYAKGINHSLNDRLNALFRTGAKLTPTAADMLHKEFFDVSMTDRMATMSDRVAERISSINSAIDNALETAQDYSVTLSNAWYELDSAQNSTRIKEVTRKLISETARMQDDNYALTEQLSSSHDMIANLQQELDDIRRQSMLDPLTKLNNRARFDATLIEAMKQSHSSGQPLCLLLVDIDNFKAFNDSYGHLTGDQVLRLVAGQIQSGLQGHGTAARFGGEEFAAILPDTDLRSAIFAAEAMREAIQAKQLLRISTSERLGNLTASIGVAKFGPKDSFASIIDRADACLYEAKRLGRNRVIGEDELLVSHARDFAASVA